MKVLHILYQSLPTISGSTIRSRDLLSAQIENGIDVVAITSPFQNGESELVDNIENVNYYRTFKGRNDELQNEGGKKRLNVLIRKLYRILAFSLYATKLAKTEKIDVVHSHSMFFCALSGKYVSKRIGVPLIYEVRSLWEERSKKNRPIMYRVFRLLEKISMSLADHIVAINENLKSDLIKRGIRPDKITVIGNAVNSNNYEVKVNPTLISKPPKEITFGYIGKISPIEGLELLLETFVQLKEDDITNKLYLVGDGPVRNSLEDLKSKYKLTNVEFSNGKVHYSEITRWYEKIDVIINPRYKSHLADSVTPIKPLEAMINKKLVLTSDVGGMKELVSDMKNGITFHSDDKSSLISKFKFILNPDNKDKIEKLIQNGYEYVLLEKSWSSNGKKYLNLYRRIL